MELFNIEKCKKCLYYQKCFYMGDEPEGGCEDFKDSSKVIELFDEDDVFKIRGDIINELIIANNRNRKCQKNENATTYEKNIKKDYLKEAVNIIKFKEVYLFPNYNAECDSYNQYNLKTAVCIDECFKYLNENTDETRLSLITTQPHFLNFKYSDRLFVVIANRDNDGDIEYSTHEITLGECEGTDREITTSLNLEKLLYSGEFSWYRPDFIR